ncbi:pilus assembly protein [Actinomyces sp. B33]|uniref:TadE/TadG family type IV pilus assembly protein n=1 Tax=Actinomyces sp. B33 TaxID=2942131 RepID=UPI00233FFC80|nr:TadE family protein [Actinomyces sp. B33]MDC4232354.1 pilus assembly protein [Actinomyces sp. B33]
MLVDTAGFHLRCRKPLVEHRFSTRREASQDGSTTVELAIGFFAVMVVISLIVAVSAVGLTRSALCQSVREGARAASIGQESAQEAAARAYSRGGPAPAISVARSDRWITVTGTVPVAGIPGLPPARCEVTTTLEQAIP